ILVDGVGAAGGERASYQRGRHQPQRRRSPVRQDHGGDRRHQQQHHDSRLRQLVEREEDRPDPQRRGGVHRGPDRRLHRTSPDRLATTVVATSAPQIRGARATWAVTAAGDSLDHTFTAPTRIWATNSPAAVSARAATAANDLRSDQAPAARTTTATNTPAARARWENCSAGRNAPRCGTTRPFISGQSGKARLAPSPRT